MQQPQHSHKPAWRRTLSTLWYFPLIHVALPALVPGQRWAWCPPQPMRVVGWLLAMLGAAVGAVSLATLVGHGDGTPAPFDPPRRLVQHGPYGVCRNPLELGNLLMLCGRALATGQLRFVFASVIFALGHHLWFVLVEEPSLHRRFGVPYAKYCTRVPRWGIQISALHTPRYANTKPPTTSS